MRVCLCVFAALALCARADLLFDEHGRITHPEEVQRLPENQFVRNFHTTSSGNVLLAKHKHYFPSEKELYELKAKHEEKFMKGAIERLMTDMEPDEVLIVHAMTLFGVIGSALSFIFCFGCFVTCCCGAETCQNIYSPFLRCTIKSLCWPVWCMYSACSLCGKQCRKLRAKKR